MGDDGARRAKPTRTAYFSLLHRAAQYGITVDRLDRLVQGGRYHVWVGHPRCLRDVYCRDYEDAAREVDSIVEAIRGGGDRGGGNA